MAKVSDKLYHDHFGKKVFWDEKFAKDSTLFEWYHPYKMIRDVITQYIKDPPAARVLNVGCGTSKLPEDMYNDGFRNIISIDSSEDCVQTMRARFNEKMPKSFAFLKMDALKMTFQDKVFSHVIDKGTFDSIASGYRSTENLNCYLREVNRVMQDQGIFFCLSHRGLDERAPFFDRVKWRVAVHRVYRPEFKTELRFIKQDFISKTVTESIEKEKEVDVDPDKINVNNDPNDHDIIERLLEMEKTEKKEREEAIKALKPRDVLCYYLYVCFKGPVVVEKSKVEENHWISSEENDLGARNDSIEMNRSKMQAHASHEGEEEGQYEMGDEEHAGPSMSEMED